MSTSNIRAADTYLQWHFILWQLKNSYRSTDMSPGTINSRKKTNRYSI
jgi:hypothetical protein